MNRLILFLVRRKLGVRKNQLFRLKNQLDITECYWFTKDALMMRLWNGHTQRATESLNWLLSSECVVTAKDNLPKK